MMRHPGYVRNFEWVIRELNERGHTVHLGFERQWRGVAGVEADEIIKRLVGDYEHVTCEYLAARDDRWSSLAFDLRQGISYLRYLRPEYSHAEKIRGRSEANAPHFVVRLSKARGIRSRTGLRLLDGILRSWESAVPRACAIDGYLREGGFDLVITTPLVDGPSQVEWLRSAKAARIPAVFAVASWDNLTLKGVVSETPDRTYVWNAIQRREAATYHRIPPETVSVVGAHSFDHWFTWRPSTSRAEFCERIGLDAEQPFILYVCSSRLIARDERPLVLRWIERIRKHEALRSAGVLVRPHVDGTIWLENPLEGVSNAVVWPPAGANPFHTERRCAYYDSMYHSFAVVGINTTALIEAAIVGRRTFTYLAEDVHGGQEGTLHFHYLARDNGGALTLARSLDEHAEHLAQALRVTDDDPWRESFLSSFVRPNGLERPGASDAVEDLEEFAASFAPARGPRPHPIRRLVLAGLLGITRVRRVLRRWAKRKDTAEKRFRRLLIIRKKAIRHFRVVQLARARVAKERTRHVFSADRTHQPSPPIRTLTRRGSAIQPSSKPRQTAADDAAGNEALRPHATRDRRGSERRRR